ncbi:N-acetylmuramoyl-L-alanine amidase [Desmospora sp. 8437]|nr:N-acetylmuramoyl-L-alanine amidase [Desmospora sp. 8437]
MSCAVSGDREEKYIYTKEGDFLATKIFLDPGHGGSDAGAVGNGLQEKDVTLKIALETRRILLEEYEGVTVKMSREKDATVSLTQRTDAANAWNATFYLSIHINAGGGTGFESYRYVQNGSSTTMTAQRNLHVAVLSASGWKDRGQKWANFHVLRESKMPAVLTENGFIDTSGDAAKLKETSFLKKLGRAHAEGLAKTFGLKKKQHLHRREHFTGSSQAPTKTGPLPRISKAP